MLSVRAVEVWIFARCCFELMDSRSGLLVVYERRQRVYVHTEKRVSVPALNITGGASLFVTTRTSFRRKWTCFRDRIIRIAIRVHRS